jgi:hypothetical protein
MTISKDDKVIEVFGIKCLYQEGLRTPIMYWKGTSGETIDPDKFSHNMDITICNNRGRWGIEIRINNLKDLEFGAFAMPNDPFEVPVRMIRDSMTSHFKKLRAQARMMEYYQPNIQWG